jgi:endonuclease YncB( thermonuclease family)
LNAGLAQVTVGLAWHYKKYQHKQSAEDRQRYAFAEQEARARKAGLWQGKNPVPPWEWRRLNK